MTSASTKTRKQLNKNPRYYKTHAYLHHEVGRRLLEFISADFTPQSIIHEGVYDDFLTQRLKERFPQAVIFEEIENATHTADLTMSNLFLQDVWELEEAVRTYYAITNPQGRVYFSVIGVGSFGELLHEDGIAINGFPDIEDLGDFMLEYGFKDPALSLETLTLTYEKLETLLLDLRVVGGRPFEPFKGLRTPRWLARWQENVKKECFDGRYYHITLDVLYIEARIPQDPDEIKNKHSKGIDMNEEIFNLWTELK